MKKEIRGVEAHQVKMQERLGTAAKQQQTSRPDYSQQSAQQSEDICKMITQNVQNIFNMFGQFFSEQCGWLLDDQMISLLRIAARIWKICI